MFNNPILETYDLTEKNRHVSHLHFCAIMSGAHGRNVDKFENSYGIRI